MSMVVSDIGALELVGVAGSAYVAGLSMANYDWIGCIPAMIIAAFVFIPFYWKTEIFTIPEYLGRRYNNGVRTLVAVFWGLFMICSLGIFLFQRLQVLFSPFELIVYPHLICYLTEFSLAQYGNGQP